MIESLFGGLSERKKLKRIIDGQWTCSSCQETHSGLFDLAAFSPDFWNGEKTYASNSELTLEGNFLSADFCVIDGENFFVRSVLLFPVKGFDLDFGFGVWSSLSKDNFKIYVESFDEGISQTDIFWTSWFSNRLKGLDGVFKQKCWVNPQPNRQRPQIYFMDETHPVSIAQKKGLSPKQILEIFAANGHSPE